MTKLYIIVDATLEPGLKMAQACHALRDHVAHFPEHNEAWYAESNNLVVLEVEDLAGQADELEGRDYEVARFFEPDLDDQLTAIAVLGAERHVSNLRLAA